MLCKEEILRRRRSNQRRRLLLEGGGDPLYNEVLLLMPFDGSNNDTTTTDASSYNHTVTVTGESLITDADSYFVGGTSTYIDDASTSPSGWAIGPNADVFNVYDNEPWTIEFFWKATANQTADAVFFDWGGGQISIDGFRRVGVSIYRNLNNNLNNLTQAYALDLDTWYHLAFVRDTVDEECYLYLNGVSSLTGGGGSEFPMPVANTDLIGSTQPTVTVGYRSTTGQSQMYIDNFRWTHGTCRYPGGVTFDVPEEAFPTS